NLPDLRGYLLAGKDDMGGAAASRITAGASGIDGSVLGAAGGAQTVTLITAQMPAHGHGVTDPTHNHVVSDPTHVHGVSDPTHVQNGPFSPKQPTNGGPALFGYVDGIGAPAARRSPPRPESRSKPPPPASASTWPAPASRSSRPAAARTRTCRRRA